MKIFFTLLLVLCCPGLENAFAAEQFSLYGVDFSMDYAQTLQNGLDREYIVSASTVPKEFKDDVGTLRPDYLRPPWLSFPPDVGQATDLPRETILTAKENFIPLETHHIGKYRVDLIRYEINDASGETISTLEICFFTDVAGKQAPAFMKLNTKAHMEVWQALHDRYGENMTRTNELTPRFVWRVGDVYASTPDADWTSDSYYKPGSRSKTTSSSFDAIQVNVMRDFINFVYDEVVALSQKKNAQKAAEEARKHQERLGGI